MQKEIISVISELGRNENEFYICDGARSENSEIHIELQSKREKLVGVKYAIQFEHNLRLLVLASIENRVKDGNASLNLDYKGKHWYEFKDLSEYTEYIRSSKDRNPQLDVRLILMRFDHLYDWLDKGIENDIEDNIEDKFTSYSIAIGKEGKCYSIYSTKYERKQSLREEAIRSHGYKCCICGFDFEEVYGVHGKEFIEVHHIKPLNGYKHEHLVDAKKDMISVCANCHRMIHREKEKTLSPEELKEIIKANKKI